MKDFPGVIFQKHLKTYTTSSCLGHEKADGINNKQHENPRNKEAQEETTVGTKGFKMLAQNPENPECYMQAYNWIQT